MLWCGDHCIFTMYDGRCIFAVYSEHAPLLHCVLFDVQNCLYNTVQLLDIHQVDITVQIKFKIAQVGYRYIGYFSSYRC